VQKSTNATSGIWYLTGDWEMPFQFKKKNRNMKAQSIWFATVRNILNIKRKMKIKV